MTPKTLAITLSGARFSLVSEKKTQDDIEAFLTGRCIDFSREHRMLATDGKTDIPDFMVGGILVEVKANGASAGPTIRQLERYAAHPEVTAIILVTNRAMNPPSEINGKPVLALSTGRAWL